MSSGGSSSRSSSSSSSSSSNSRRVTFSSTRLQSNNPDPNHPRNALSSDSGNGSDTSKSARYSSKEEVLYGSFLEDDDSDEGGRRGPRRGGHPASKSISFVSKGETFSRNNKNDRSNRGINSSNSGFRVTQLMDAAYGSDNNGSDSDFGGAGGDSDSEDESYLKFSRSNLKSPYGRNNKSGIEMYSNQDSDDVDLDIDVDKYATNTTIAASNATAANVTNNKNDDDDDDDDMEVEVILTGKGRNRAPSSSSTSSYSTSSSTNISITSKTNADFLIMLNMSEEQKNEIAPLSSTGSTSEDISEKATKPKINLPSVKIENLGSWQQHTTGIGMKYLQKFGFKGRLGANEEGVSRTIEVVVRPDKLGLGFGDFKEAASLKSNKLFQAELHGEQYIPDDRDDDIEGDGEGGDDIKINDGKKSFSSKKNKNRNYDWTYKSNVEKMTEEANWKKGSNKSKDAAASFKSKSTTKMLSVEDFINLSKQEHEKEVIFDMRGPQERILTDLSSYSHTNSVSATPGALLGEELLHNIDLVVVSTEAELMRRSRELNQLHTKIINESSNKERLDERIATDSGRRDRLSKIIQILDRVEVKIASDIKSLTISGIASLFKTLRSNFLEEFNMFRLMFMFPILVKPILVRKVNNWQPANNPDLLLDLYDSWEPVRSIFEDDGALMEDIQFILVDFITSSCLPLIRSYMTNEWDPMYPSTGIKLMSHLALIIPSHAINQLYNTIVLPKLSAVVDNWTPNCSKYAMSSFISPWIGIMDHDRLSMSYPDIKRKLVKGLETWNPMSHADNKWALENVLASRDIFDESSFDNFILKCIVPRLVTVMSELAIDPRKDLDQMSVLGDVAAWQDAVPILLFSAIFEGELFPKWLEVLNNWLVHPDADLEEISQWYLGWKALLSESLCVRSEISLFLNKALEMMNATVLCYDYDEGVIDSKALCSTLAQIFEGKSRYKSFYQIFEERSASADKNSSTSSNSCNSSRNKLAFSKQSFNSNSYSNINTSLTNSACANGSGNSNNISSLLFTTLNNFHVSTISFREIVESQSAQHGIEFSPKFGRFALGKQVYQLGKCAVYLDQDVLYLQRPGDAKAAFIPTELESALLIAK